MRIIFKEFQPSGMLSPYVELFWSGVFNRDKSDFLSQRVVPNGYVELIIHLSDTHCELLQGQDFQPSPDYTLIGVFVKPYEVHFKKMVRVFGIRFKPEAIEHVFALPASEIQAYFADITSVTGRDFREYSSRLREMTSTPEMIQLSEDYLLKSVANRKAQLTYLDRAAEIIRRRKGFISIDELADEVYISPRQLEREFRRKIGISPKRYMRIARLNQVNRLIQNGNMLSLTHLAYACGYADQAHFTREFKYFTGESPKVVLKERDRFIINPNASDL